jgi:hypothetical protein
MIYRVISGLMTLLFLFSVVVQYNDPDPYLWMPEYGAAAIVSAWAVVRRPPWWVPAVVLIPTLIWGAMWIPRVIGHTTLGDVFGTIGMNNVHAEEGRELLGLAIVASWMLVVLMMALRARRAARAGA